MTSTTQATKQTRSVYVAVTTKRGSQFYDYTTDDDGQTYRAKAVQQPRPGQREWLVTRQPGDWFSCNCPQFDRYGECKHATHGQDAEAMMAIKYRKVSEPAAEQIAKLAADFDADADAERQATIAAGKRYAEELFPSEQPAAIDRRRQGLSAAANWTEHDIDVLVAQEAADPDPYATPDRARFLHEQTRDWARQQLA